MMRPRVVLDTNVLVSALLFGRGNVAWCRQGWQNSRFLPLVNHDTAQELINVLAYPKFKLSTSEQKQLLAEFLPYAQVVTNRANLKQLPKLRDADDTKFLALAIAGHADVLVSGDKDILDMDRDTFNIPLQTPSQFRRWLEAIK